MPGPLFTSMTMHHNHNRLIMVAATRKPHLETIQTLPNTQSSVILYPSALQNPFVGKKTSTSTVPTPAGTVFGIVAVACGVQVLRNGFPPFKHTHNSSPPTPSNVEHITNMIPISETTMSSNVLKSPTRANAVPFIKLFPSVPKKAEVPPSFSDHKQVLFRPEVIPYDQEILKSLQQAVESLQLAVLSLTEAVTSVQEAIKSVRSDSPSVHPVTPTVNPSVTVPPEREGMKMVNETQVATTPSSNVVARAPTECHPAGNNQERLPGKSRRGRKKSDKRRNRKNQLQKTEAQDKGQLDDVSTTKPPSVLSSETLEDNGNDTRAQAQSNEDSVEPEVQRGPRKPLGKGRKREPRVRRGRRDVNTPHEVTGSNGNAFSQKENPSSSAVVSQNNAEGPNNPCASSQPVLPKQKNRKYKGKGQRKGSRCDQHNPQVQRQVRERAGVPVDRTPALQGRSEQDPGIQPGLSDRTNQLPAIPHENSRELASDIPSRAVSPKARGNIRILHNNSNGTNGNRPAPPVSRPAANGERRTDPAVFAPTMSVTPRTTESRAEVRPNAFGANASASSVGNREPDASQQFPFPRTQISGSSQDVRNGIGLPIRTEKRWKPRHRMNRG